MAESAVTETAVGADNLLAGPGARTLGVTLAAGEGEVARGTLLGRADRQPGTPTADAGNTGDGAVSGVAPGVGAHPGDYRVECIAAAAGAGTFAVYDPAGHRLRDAVAGTPYSNAHLSFSLSAGGTDYVVGDGFAVPVATVEDAEWRVYDPAATDGSQVPRAICATTVDATSEATETNAYRRGTFRASEVVGYTADLEDELADRGLLIV